MSNFSFSHSVLKRLVSQGHQKVSLCGNGLTQFSILPVFPSTLHRIISKPLAAFKHNHYQKSSVARGMNPVAMIIINTWRDYWLSQGPNLQPPVLKSCTLQTESHCLRKIRQNVNKDY